MKRSHWIRNQTNICYKLYKLATGKRSKVLLTRIKKFSFKQTVSIDSLKFSCVLNISNCASRDLCLICT